MMSFSFGLTEPEQPIIDESNPTASNELIEDYNKQVDEYNNEVDAYNQQVDNDYKEAYEAYTEEKEKVEANNEFVDKAEEKVEADSSEARGFENNSTNELPPTDWEDETSEENLKTIQIEKSDNPTGKIVKVINIHVYLKEDAVFDNLTATFYDSIEDDTFVLSENIKNNAALIEWEVANLDYDDTVTLTSQTSVFAGNTAQIKGKEQWLGINNGRLILTSNPNVTPINYPFYYFLRSIDGYTQGYWSIDSDMYSANATEVNYGYSGGTTYGIHYAEEPAIVHYAYNGQDMTEEITVRTTDRQKPTNIFTLFTYIFKRLAPEPEKQELPTEPIKEAYLSHLDKLNLLEIPTVESTESTPTPVPVPTVKNLIYGYDAPEDEVVIAATNPPATIINAPTPKAEPQGNWALINLIATIFACICAFALLFVRKDTEDDEPTDEEKKDMRKIIATKIASIIVGIGAVIVFILTEDMSLPMILTDKWTLLMIFLLIIEIINIFIIRKQSKGEENNGTN